jgi:hypothetical protein
MMRSETRCVPFCPDPRCIVSRNTCKDPEPSRCSRRVRVRMPSSRFEPGALSDHGKAIDVGSLHFNRVRKADVYFGSINCESRRTSILGSGRCELLIPHSCRSPKSAVGRTRKFGRDFQFWEPDQSVRIGLTCSPQLIDRGS